MLFDVDDRVQVIPDQMLSEVIADKVSDADGVGLIGYVTSVVVDEADGRVSYMVNFPRLGVARLFAEGSLVPVPEAGLA